MSKNPAQFNDINLLPEDPFFSTFFGRVIRWALSVGRYLIIFTELVVIVSFATRFKLDRKRTDLNNSIAQKVAIIQSYGDVEEQFKTIQKRIDYFKNINSQHIDTDLFVYLNQIIPDNIIIDKLTITQDSVSVSGIAPNQEEFNTLIINLKQSDKFDTVTVGKIEKNSKTQEIEFKFNASLKQDLPKQAPQNN